MRGCSCVLKLGWWVGADEALTAQAAPQASYLVRFTRGREGPPFLKRASIVACLGLNPCTGGPGFFVPKGKGWCPACAHFGSRYRGETPTGGGGAACPEGQGEADGGSAPRLGRALPHARANGPPTAGAALRPRPSGHRLCDPEKESPGDAGGPQDQPPARSDVSPVLRGQRWPRRSIKAELSSENLWSCLVSVHRVLHVHGVLRCTGSRPRGKRRGFLGSQDQPVIERERTQSLVEPFLSSG